MDNLLMRSKLYDVGIGMYYKNASGRFNRDLM